MNITNCTYSLYVSLTWHFHHTAVASVAVYCRDAGPVFTRCHISGTVPARQCSTLLYMFLRPSLSQSQSADCCNAVSCSAAWRSGDVSRVTTGMGHNTYHRTRCRGDDDDPQICAAIGVFKTFSCFLTIPNINIFRTWQSSEQSSAVWCVARPRLQRWPPQWDVWIKCWLGGILEFRHLTDFHSQNPRWLSMQVSPALGHHAPPVPSPYTQILSFSVTHGAGWWDEDIRGQGVIISNPISSWSPHHHHQLPIAMKMELNVPGT